MPYLSFRQFELKGRAVEDRARFLQNIPGLVGFRLGFWVLGLAKWEYFLLRCRLT